ARGLQYGPAFQRVEQVWSGDGEALGIVMPADGAAGDAANVTSLLDACFQVSGPALTSAAADSGDALLLPIGLERLRIIDRAGLAGKLWCHAVARPSDDAATVLTGDISLLRETGELVTEIIGLRVRRLAPAHTSPGPESTASADGRPTHDAVQHVAVGQAAPADRPVDLAPYLTGLVAKAVGRPAAQIDPERSLGDMGLDSLMAMELRNRIDADLGVVVPLTTFLQGPSVHDLLATVTDLLRATPTLHEPQEQLPALASSLAQCTDRDLALSHGQRALWLTHQMAPQSRAYHIMFAARLPGHTDAQAMDTAVRGLVSRHESLRTTYALSTDGTPVQRIHTEMPSCFTVASADGWSEADLHTRLGEAADLPFDLERGPLLRVTLFRRAHADDVLLLAVHHLAVDFWSLEVLVEELRALYEAALAGRPANLPAATQYAEFVRRQADALAGPAGDDLWRYWQQKLGGDLPVLALPTDRPRSRVQTYRGGLCDFELDDSLTSKLRDLARAEGATLYATLLAAFSALLARYTGQDDVLIGSPMAGRSRADLERTVGYLVNVLPLRADLAGQPTFRELVRQIRDTLLEALDHQDYPFSLLVERLRPARDPGRSPLVQVLFIWYRSALLEASGGDGAASEREVVAWEQRGAPYDLMLLMTEVHGGLVGRLQYNADLFNAETMQRLAGHFRRLLESVLSDPDQPVGAARMLTAAERVQQLVSWNETEAAYPSDACLHQLFEAQAARTPDAIALTCGAESLTYRVLNQRANRIARRLRALGVGPETLVGVCLPRTPTMVAAILGVLKAGGAYLPLDPAYPQTRLSFVLRDARAAVVLTQRSHVDRLDGQGAEIVCLDDPAALGDVPGDLADENLPPVGVTPASLAYVIYTSGSTGQPKGVMIEHRGPVALMAWARDQFSPEDLARVLASTSICFDLSVFELFAPLSWGGTVVLVENVLQLPQMAAADVTLVNTVPAA
ncbi:MAG: condensation domain-containing protein, partial [Chloroflexota bacterium]